MSCHINSRTIKYSAAYDTRSDRSKSSGTTLRVRFRSYLFLVVGPLGLELVAASLGLAQFELQYPTVLGRRLQFALHFAQFRRLVVTKRISKLCARTRPPPGVADEMLNILYTRKATKRRQRHRRHVIIMCVISTPDVVAY